MKMTIEMSRIIYQIKKNVINYFKKYNINIDDITRTL